MGNDSPTLGFGRLFTSCSCLVLATVCIILFAWQVSKEEPSVADVQRLLREVPPGDWPNHVKRSLEGLKPTDLVEEPMLQAMRSHHRSSVVILSTVFCVAAAMFAAGGLSLFLRRPTAVTTNR